MGCIIRIIAFASWRCRMAQGVQRCSPIVPHVFQCSPDVNASACGAAENEGARGGDIDILIYTGSSSNLLLFGYFAYSVQTSLSGSLCNQDQVRSPCIDGWFNSIPRFCQLQSCKELSPNCNNRGQTSSPNCVLRQNTRKKNQVFRKQILTDYGRIAFIAEIKHICSVLDKGPPQNVR